MHNHHLDHLSSLAPDVERLVPEIGAAFLPCLRSLRIVHKLHLSGDRRLLGIDATNLRTGLDRLLMLREEGVGTPHLDKAASDLARLVADMHARASALIAAESHDIALHTTIATRKASDAPFDVTQNLRMITAAPAPQDTDTPGRLIAVAALASPDADGTYGRVAGAITTALLPGAITAAPRGSVIIPIHSVVRLQPSDAVLVHTQGWAYTGRTTSPQKTETISTLLVEAGAQGATIYGPAVISTDPDAQGILTDLVALRQHTDRLDAAMPRHHVCLQLPAFVMMAAIMTLPVAITAELVQFLSRAAFDVDIFQGMVYQGVHDARMIAPPSLLLAFLTLAGLRAHSLRTTATLQAQGPSATHQSSIVERVASLLRRFRPQVHQTAYTTHPNAPDFLAYPGRDHLPVFDAKLARSIATGDGLNIHPPAFVEALDDEDVQIMRPLLALPAPSPVDDVVIPLHSRAKA